MNATPKHNSYDVIIIGGAIMGSSAAWFLSQNSDFNGRILVVERDASYEYCSTAHTNSCMRQQFSNELNIRISQFAAHFVKNLRDYIGDERVPDLDIQSYGYMYLANNKTFADQLRSAQKIQHAAGAKTQLLNAQQIKQKYPFYYTDDLLLGSINLQDEGYWDGGTVFDWWRRSANNHGVEYIQNEVVGIAVKNNRVQSITLADDTQIHCGQVVNATGPRGARTAAMAGLSLPVEPRKRFTWIFTAQQPLEQELPLTIDPSGVHMRQDGPQSYLAGSSPDGDDPAVDYDDFAMHHNLWQDKVWPIIATRIPQFEAIKVTTEWAGHYAYNTFDQNAILGPHSQVRNFIFLNGFSGHGLQQSPAMGRAVAEWITYGQYRSLDMTPFRYDRIPRGEPFLEQAVI